jgi:hypothetical protein
MNKIYTEEKLISFFYHESDTLESFEIEDAIETNFHCNQAYTKLSNELLDLRKLAYQPKQKSLDNILAYSKSCL